MPQIGDKERATQNRVVKLFQSDLGYSYLGNWQDRAGNRNIESKLLEDWLTKRGIAPKLISGTLLQLEHAATDASKSPYDRNRTVYSLLRYGVKVSPGAGEPPVTVWLVDWKNPASNHFGIAEEVTVAGVDATANTKRPDIVLYVNGIALGVLELKRSSVSVEQGIRQNIDSQKPMFIAPFFSTMQLVMAGSDTKGIRYGTIETKEKYYLAWKEESEVANLLDRDLLQVCNKERFLELIHDFIVYDMGIKKLCRHNQYFGVKATQEFLKRREGGIIWHTQGSGKSLTMVWLAKWIRENMPGSRVLIITDRTELDEQIEKVFKGVDEQIVRTKSGSDLIQKLNVTDDWLLCSLIHKFGGKDDAEADVDSYVEELKKALPTGFRAKGDIIVFVDECHRTQSGMLHDAMREILPSALFIGFTGTPLLKADKRRSIEVFGRYIHTYKFDEAVSDGVVLDLRYEARDIDQYIKSPKKIDEWFELKTKGLTPIAKAELKKRWGTLQKVFSSQDRLELIVDDILTDFAKRDRLMNGRGNAMLVTSSIYQACKVYELFSKTELADRCAVITSYQPTAASIKGEDSGAGETERLQQYEIYQKMLKGKTPEEFEKEVKKKFIEEPGQMQLLIVVDKLLTGFDAPSATYLYIDKQMQDHGLFQAICRVNRLDGEDKEYGYIIDYKDLFDSLKGTIHDYTSGAFEGYDQADVAGLLKDRLASAKAQLLGTLEQVEALCELVEPPRDSDAFYHYFSSQERGNAEQLKATESRRLTLYKQVAALLRAYANIAGEMDEAGFTAAEAERIKQRVSFFEKLRGEIKIHSGDAIDLKQYEPAMRHLIDSYIRADESEVVSSLNDMSLIQLIVERGVDAVDALPPGIRGSRGAVAETIENNVRKLIIDESPINPKYYEKMSELLETLIEQRKADALEYKAYLEQLVDLTQQIKKPATTAYPSVINTSGLRALYDNLGKDEAKVLETHQAVLDTRQQGWRTGPLKEKAIRIGIKKVLGDDSELLDQILGIIRQHDEY